ncbi:MAG: SDR family NAD(P)-dependent oxidoreductase [Nitriliruptoraceae bacterium]|nr:SDR family NAD(P)-dependent oxidoreductase [Nitriliruptoraceae bacterium]
MRSAVVTGASRGLGAAFARVLAEEGFALTLGARDTGELEQVAERIRAATQAEVAVHALDVTDTASVRALADQALARFGQVDLVVANAGIGSFAPLVAMDEERFRSILDVNVLGVFRTMRAFVGPLHDAPSTGSFVVISSDVSERVFPNGGAYVSSKHAVRALLRTFQQEHPDLRVCEVQPGSTRTAFNDADPEEPPGEGQLTAAEVAEAFRVLVRAPDHVRIEELKLRSTGQFPDY